MGVIQSFERRLQGAVAGTFARLFGGTVHPTEVATALQQEAAGHLQHQGGRTIAPNHYQVRLGSTDRQDLGADHDRAEDALSDMIREYLDEQGWQTFGDVAVTLEESPNLHTGQFRVSSLIDPDVDRRARHRSEGVGHMSHPGESGYPQYQHPHAPASGEQPAAEQGPPSQPQAPQSAPYGQPGYDQYGQPLHPGQQVQQPHYPGYDQYAQQAQQAQHPQQYDQYGQPLQQPQYDQYGQPLHPGQYPQQYGQQHPGQYAPPPQQYPGYGQQYPQPQYDPYGQAPQQAQQQGQQPAQQQQYSDPYSQAQPVAAPPSQPLVPEATAVLTVDDGSHRTYQLQRGSNIIGRGQDAHFRLPDTSVSRRHVDIYFDGQVSVMHDLGSTNGTTVNGSTVQTWQLAEGDVIRIGHSTVVFNLH